MELVEKKECMRKGDTGLNMLLFFHYLCSYPDLCSFCILYQVTEIRTCIESFHLKMLILTFFRKAKAIKLRECEGHIRCVNLSSYAWLFKK